MGGSAAETPGTAKAVPGGLVVIHLAVGVHRSGHASSACNEITGNWTTEACAVTCLRCRETHVFRGIR